MNSLFDFPADSSENLLLKDGTVNYYGKVFSLEEAESFFDVLLSKINWKHDEAMIMGKLIQTKRKVAWYGSKIFEYKYSGIIKHAQLWSPELLILKEKVESLTGESYNSCLLNLYHDGSEGMAYHSDSEKDLKKNGAIACVSFGAERKFSFKHISTKEKVDIFLENGSLLVMKDETQSFWQHRIPPTTKVHSARISLTFRTIVGQD